MNTMNLLEWDQHHHKVCHHLLLKKNKKLGNVYEFDEALIKILANTQNMQMDDEECFGKHIDATLHCFSPKQKALAKL